MYFYLLLGLSGVVVGKMADIEGRNAWVWAIATIVAGWFLSAYLGWFAIATPAITLVFGFVALWIAKARDDRRSGKQF